MSRLAARNLAPLRNHRSCLLVNDLRASRTYVNGFWEVEVPDRAEDCPRCGNRVAGTPHCARCLLELGLERDGFWTPRMGRATEIPGSIGGYRILGRLGEGGMAVVYCAESPAGEAVALKLLKEEFDSPRPRSRFLAEYGILRRMDHPGIVRALDQGETEQGLPFFAMELVNGQAICDYCSRRVLPLARRLELFIQVCRAVQHVHDRGYLHRDLKPQNILVADDRGRPFPKVIDFGVAQPIGARSQGTAPHWRLRELTGTPEYMSPEQADGTRKVDGRSDVYSLGGVLYALIAGRPPFDPEALRHAAPAENLRRLRQDRPPPPSALRAEVPTRGQRVALDRIVLKALAKSPDRRQASPCALAHSVRRWGSADEA